MLDRNRRIKSTPQRFQEYSGQFDVVITVEERVYDQVLEGNTEYLRVVFIEITFQAFFLQILTTANKRLCNLST